MEYQDRKFVEYPPLGGYNTTLNVLPSHTVLMAKCKACGAMRELDRATLQTKTMSHEVWLPDTEKRLSCSACGEKRAKLMTGYFAASED